MLKKYGRCVKMMIIALTLVLGTIGGAYAQATDEDVFAVVTINNLGEFLTNAAQFADKVQPGSGAMLTPEMLGAQVFKNPTLAGMDQAGTYSLVVMNPQKYAAAQPLALVVPITSKDEFVKAISQAMTPGAETNGILTFTDPNQKNSFVAFTEKNAILTDNSDLAAAVKGLLEANSPALQEKLAVKGQLTSSIAISKVIETFRPMIDMFKQAALSGMQQAAQKAEGQGAKAQQQAAVANVLQAEIDTTLALLEQAEKLQLGVNIEDEGLRISNALIAKADGSMAKFIVAQTPAESKLLGYVPIDASIAGSANINFTPEFVDGYMGFIQAMIAAAPQQDAAAFEKMTQWAKQAFTVFGGEFAFAGLGSEEDSMITYIFNVKDAAQATQMFEQYPDMMKSMSGLYENMGMKMNMSLTGKTDVKGGKILDFDLGFDASAIADPKGKEAFDKIFGEKMTLPVGLTGNLGVIGLGKNARGQVESIMEQIDSKAEVTSAYLPLEFGLPKENNFFMYLSIPKMMKWIAQYAPEAPEFEVSEDAPGIGMTAKFAENRFESELFVPIDEILAIQAIPFNKTKATEQPAEQPTEEGTPTPTK